MAYDAELADRVRGAVSQEKKVREVKMFGGLAFMVNEHMVACVSGGGGALLVRVAGDRDAEYLDVDGARRAEMGKGRSMGEGWITVDNDALEEDSDLQFWIDAVLEFNAEKTRDTDQPVRQGVLSTSRPRRSSRGRRGGARSQSGADVSWGDGPQHRVAEAPSARRAQPRQAGLSRP